MESLETFTASKNKRQGRDGLSGPLPESLGSLVNLYQFDVSSNSLTGEISVLGECTNLEIVNLQENNFGGGVPAEFGSFSYLESVNLKDNNLEGGVPTGMCEAREDGGKATIQVDCSVSCADGCCTDYDCSDW